LLDELGIDQPDEIAVEAIAQYCGATVVYEELQGCEAQIIGSDNRAIIGVKRDALRSRQRFSIAHELGHWIRDRGKLAGFTCTAKSFVSEWSREGKDNPERRANRFAADLLLPEKMFKPDARDREMTFATASLLAARYETSLTATALRLVELGSFPAMLVCTEGGRRKWFVPSRDVRGLWPVDSIGTDSAAYDLLHGTSGPEGAVEVAASSWIDRAEASRYVLCEDSKRVGDFVLSLLWWKDERQLADLLRSEDDDSR
jgi:hypothetical protein